MLILRGVYRLRFFKSHFPPIGPPHANCKVEGRHISSTDKSIKQSLALK